MTDNPYSSEQFEPPPIQPNGWAKSVLYKLCGFGVVVLALAFLLIPARRNARPAAYRMQCMNNMKQIGLALLSYEEQYQTFPPAFTTSADGQRLHSWRTLILPFMEHSELYAKIDLTQPWNADVNRSARETYIDSYSCPSSSVSAGLTTYFAIVGPNAALLPQGGRRTNQITDGPENTCLIYDGPAAVASHWMQPIDPELPLDLRQLGRLSHAGGLPVLMADGAGHFLGIETSPETVAGLKTVDGGEIFELP